MVNDKNFDSFKNLKTPQKWIDNAINIPNTKKKSAPVFFIKYSKYIVAAACLVLVCAVSILVYSSNNKANIPLAKSPDVTQHENGEVEQKPSQPQNSGSSHNALQDNNDKNTPSKNDTEKPDKQSQDDANKAESETEEATKEKDETQEEPTNKDESSSETPPEEESTDPPKDNPTEKPSKPSNKPKPPAPPIKPGTDGSTPGNPGSPSTPSRPGGSVPDDGYATFSIEIDTKYLTSGETIYCTITDQSNNTIISDSPVYVYRSGNTAYASYELYLWNVPYSGYYTCHFFTYDNNIDSDTEYISIQ